MKNKVSIYLQQPHQLKLDNLAESFPKLNAFLKKKGLFVESTISICTCFRDSTPNIILFADTKGNTTISSIETLTEKEANSLFTLIKKSE